MFKTCQTILLILLLCLLSAGRSCAQQVEWLHYGTIKNTSYHDNKMLYDGRGNCYFFNQFDSVIYFDNKFIGDPNYRKFGAFIDAVNDKGSRRWTLPLYSNSKVPIRLMPAGFLPDGNMIICGSTGGQTKIANIDLPDSTVFITKLDTGGHIIWLHSLISANYTSYARYGGHYKTSFNLLDCNTDINGNTSLAFILDADSINFNGKTIKGTKHQIMLLARFDANGKMEWCRTFGDFGSSSILGSLKCDKIGNIYLAFPIYPGDSLIVDKSKYYTGFDGTCLLAKFNIDGKLVWHKLLNCDDAIYCKITLAQDSILYVSSQFIYKININKAINTYPNVNYKSFIVKMDTAANIEWVH